MKRNIKRMVTVIGEMKELAARNGDEHVVKVSRRVLARRLKITPTGVWNAISNLEKSGMIKVYRKSTAGNIFGFVDND